MDDFLTDDIGAIDWADARAIVAELTRETRTSQIDALARDLLATEGECEE